MITCTGRGELEYIGGLRFRSQKEKHELSYIYEAKIKNKGKAGCKGGELTASQPNNMLMNCR